MSNFDVGHRDPLFCRSVSAKFLSSIGSIEISLTYRTYVARSSYEDYFQDYQPALSGTTELRSSSRTITVTQNIGPASTLKGRPSLKASTTHGITFG